MGLSQLLAASRTVRNIKNHPSRFKMTQQNLLPKFGAERADEPQSAGEAGGADEQVAEPVMNASVAVEQGRNEPAPARVVAVAEAVKKLRPFGSWSLFKNPFRKAETRKIEARPAQAELLLDLVKPVRNDLSEVGFELGRMPQQAVSTAPAKQEQTAVPTPSPSGKGSAGGLWRRLKTRLLGVSDTN